VSGLLVHPGAADGDGTRIRVTPESAGWGHVGFELVALAPGGVARRDTGDREVCIVAVHGTAHVRSGHGEWRDLGGRPTPFDGPPDAAYLPPGSAFELEGATGGAEIALCSGPAPGGGAPARRLPAAETVVETRGHGAHERYVTNILMDGAPADSLLVCEVLTPAGHWSSYPPHKHDRDALPAESLLEETYYHRIAPAHGFGLQRVYSGDRTLDETLSFGDGDLVLVPRGYHTVSAPPGYTVYYLNVMAGPVRAWAVANDPDHEWTLQP
jgi:5-deoxy-glucuronate isomerase